MTKKLKITLLLGFFLLAKSNLGLGQSLDLQEYLKQVKDSHPSIKAAKLTAEAQIEKNQDLELMLSPRIKSELSHSYDKKTELMPSGPYPSTDHTQKLEFSWIKSLKNGMNLRISQFFSHTLKDPKGDRPSNSHDFMPLSQIELSVPLLKNRGGREYEWQKKQLEFRIKADQSAEDFKVNSILIEAEAAYWRLALSREQKGTVAASLKRAELIEKIQAKKAKDLLSDEADYLQARGLRENREMDLKSSIEDERQAAFSLNNFRQNTAQEVPESLPSLGPELMGKLILPTKKGERRDLLSMKHQYEALGQ